MSLGIALALANAAWTPPPPTNVASLKMWLDPTRGVVVSGGNISTWTDVVSGVVMTANGSGATEGTGINGRTTVEMAGGGLFLAGSQSISQIVSAGGYWVLAVWQYRGSVAQGSVGSMPYLIGDSATYWTKSVSTTKLNHAHYDGSQENDESSTSVSTNYVALMSYNGSRLQTAINGSTFDTGVSAGSIASLSNTIQVGANGYLGSYGDLIVGNEALSAYDAGNLMLWAMDRYSI